MVLITGRMWFLWGEHTSSTSPPGKPDYSRYWVYMILSLFFKLWFLHAQRWSITRHTHSWLIVDVVTMTAGLGIFPVLDHYYCQLQVISHNIWWYLQHHHNNKEQKVNKDRLHTTLRTNSTQDHAWSPFSMVCVVVPHSE